MPPPTNRRTVGDHLDLQQFIMSCLQKIISTMVAGGEAIYLICVICGLL